VPELQLQSAWSKPMRKFWHPTGFVVAGAVFWGESSAPETYSSFLVPEYHLPRLDPHHSYPSERQPIYTPYPQRR
jgi:hypothetical protein